MPAAKGPKGFEFISSDSRGKPAADTRNFIRSHVMRGKNIRKRVQRLSQPSSESSASQVPALSEHAAEDSPSAGHSREQHVRNNYVAVPEGAQGYTCVAFPWAFPSPIMMPPDMRLLDFPEVMDDKMRGLMFRCKSLLLHNLLLLPHL